LLAFSLFILVLSFLISIIYGLITIFESFIIGVSFILSGTIGITLVLHFWRAINDIEELKKVLNKQIRRSNQMEKKLDEMKPPTNE